MAKMSQHGEEARPPLGNYFGEKVSGTAQMRAEYAFQS
jgi:hypothetical protein